MVTFQVFNGHNGTFRRPGRTSCRPKTKMELTGDHVRDKHRCYKQNAFRINLERAEDAALIEPSKNKNLKHSARQEDLKQVPGKIPDTSTHCSAERQSG